MTRTLEEIIEQEKPEVVLQANEKAAKILKDIDEKDDPSVADEPADG